jgi:hypothetical protein
MRLSQREFLHLGLSQRIPKKGTCQPFSMYGTLRQISAGVEHLNDHGYEGAIGRARVRGGSVSSSV